MRGGEKFKLTRYWREERTKKLDYGLGGLRGLLVNCCRVKAGSLGVKSEDFMFGLEEEVSMSGRVQFPKGKRDDSPAR